MRGKVHLKAARHSVVLNCKLVPLHNTRQSLLAACYITSMWYNWQCLQIQTLGVGWTITRQPFSAVCGSKFTKFGEWAGREVPADRQVPF